jgi:[ribosomal protein S5]-alanine N-acetyltransferase
MMADTAGRKLLETERLILRHLVLDDLDDMAALYADVDFTRFFGGPSSREQARADIDAFMVEYDTIGYGFYATLLKPENRFIGRCGLLTQQLDGMREVEVAYGIAPGYWGRGLATEAARAVKEYAFRRFDFRRLVSIVDQENVASQRVAEKNGMRVERQIEFDGHPCYLYVIKRSGCGFASEIDRLLTKGGNKRRVSNSSHG